MEQWVPATTNQPPGRYAPVYWKDLGGNLWVFGGISGIELADLWKYDIATNVWTWMSGSSTPGAPGVYGTQGVPSVNNYPKARGLNANCWTDTAGNFWLYGGYGGGVNLNDLWKYNPVTNEWTWINGGNGTTTVFCNWGTKGIASASNTPGGRYECKSGWTDSTNLIMFGGQGTAHQV